HVEATLAVAVAVVEAEPPWIVGRRRHEAQRRGGWFECEEAGAQRHEDAAVLGEGVGAHPPWHAPDLVMATRRIEGVELARFHVDPVKLAVGAVPPGPLANEGACAQHAWDVGHGRSPTFLARARLRLQRRYGCSMVRRRMAFGSEGSSALLLRRVRWPGAGRKQPGATRSSGGRRIFRRTPQYRGLPGQELPF